jgi:hypothetical protein
MIKKIAFKIILLSLVVVVLDVLYAMTRYEKDLDEKSAEVVMIRQTLDTTDVYYFGESSNVTYRNDDSTKKSISGLIAMFFPGLRFTNINKYATHAGIYRHWLTQMKKKKPKAIIVTLNLRSFDAAWIHSDLETQLQESIVFTRPLPKILNRFCLSLQAFDNKTVEQREKDMLADWRNTQLRFPFPFKYRTASEWDQGMAAGGYLKPDGSWDQPRIELACHYIKAYAFNIDDKNPRTKDVDAIVAWCKEHKVKLFLNLLAENIQYADSLAGTELVFLMKENRNYLVKRYSDGNVMVIDNLESVPGHDFIDQNWTTEHYGYKGRMTIAKHVVDSMRKIFPDKYFKAF